MLTIKIPLDVLFMGILRIYLCNSEIRHEISLDSIWLNFKLFVLFDLCSVIQEAEEEIGEAYQDENNQAALLIHHDKIDGSLLMVIKIPYLDP